MAKKSFFQSGTKVDYGSEDKFGEDAVEGGIEIGGEAWVRPRGGDAG